MKPVFLIDGLAFDDLDGFYDEVSRSLGTAPWGRNLDALNDILRGGFGTPDGGFMLRWIHADRSRLALGYESTVKYLQQKLVRCHPSAVNHVAAELEAALRGVGPTLFDVLVEIIRAHCPGGPEDRDGVELELVDRDS
jgi:RNAse (barnase) inhibitor barstar